MGAECLKKSTELRRAHSDDQARIGAELPTTQRHRCGQLRSNLLTTHRERFGQQEHRVDARHLGKHRDRLRPGRGHVAQGIAALERAGETHGLDRRVLDQPLTDATAVDHVEHPRRHFRALGGADDCVRHPLGGCHVPAVGLEHSRATGGQCRGGIATGGGERQWKVAGAKHRYRPQGDAVLTQVRAWQWLAIRQRPVDARTVEITATQDFGEQAQLAAGATAFTLDTPGR
ncbi:hypothetical protein D3C73_1059160 [compost metagenome]